MKILILKLVIFFLVLFVVFETFAQDSITLEECRSQAIEYNKQLRKADLVKQEALEMQKAARTNYLPSLDASVNLMHVHGVGGFDMPGGFLPTAESEAAALNGDFSGQSDVWMPGTSIELDNLSLMYGGLNLTQPIYAGGKIRTGNKMARTGVEMAEMAYDVQYSDIIEQTDQAFWNVAMIEANINLANKYIEMLSELEDQMTSMFEVGLTPASEKLRVSVQKNEAELQLMKAENGLVLAKMNLNQILGKALTSEFSIQYDSLTPDKIQLIDLSGGPEMAKTKRNELKILDKQVSMTEYDKKMERADYLPQVGVGVQYMGSYIDNLNEEFNFRPTIAAQVSIPIYQWGQGKYKQKAAQLKVDQQKTELDHTTDMINLEVLSVKVKIEEAYQAILIAEKNVSEAEESLGETRSSFDVGLNTTTELLNAQADWLKAKVQQIQAIAQYKVLETSWEKVTGNLYTSDGY